ncbi:MAG: sigma-70 family RNA polymerase sigma factor [Patescibacteria group bacterium]|nr:sigma-70 family RNA polymerase sigma factor [Patescibacteria group bacterium]
MKKICRQLTGNNEADAEDLFQEVRLSVFKKIGQFRGKSELYTWIYRIAINANIDRLRCLKKTFKLLTRNHEEIDGHKGIGNLRIGGHKQNVNLEEENLIKNIDTNKARQVINAVLNGLPKQNRKVAKMKVQHVPDSEIAERLDISEITVRTNWLRTKREILRRLKSQSSRRKPKVKES